RSQIGYVSQTPLLFDTTVEENVRAGNTNVSLEDVVEACKLADAHEFILKLPDGYKTKVGSMGGRLSGGQKQRISIARALVYRPSILLLDEATSALDTKSEREVQKALDNISAHKSHTIITIAHRLSTITRSDNIMVLVDGEIDEMGTHEQLMDLNGMYSTLVKSQEIVSAKQEHDL
ncbi:P-glycoprotein related protein 2, partial [Reticulomyxa filosa]